VGLALAAVLSLPPGVAWAAPASPRPTPVEPTPEAREANSRAIELVRVRDFAGALDFFQKAYDLSPSYLILYNIGKMAAATRDPARALEAFERYLAEGASEIEPERRDEVESEIRELRLLVGALTVVVDEAGAEIEVDGRLRGRAPLDEPLWLVPGDHRVVVVGSRTETRRVHVEAGDAETLSVKLTAATAGPAVVASGGVPIELRTAAWVAAGVFTLGATVTGTFALVTEADLQDDVYVGPSRRPPEGSSVASKASTLEALATTTDVLVVLGAATGVAAITLSIVDAFAAPASPTEPSVALRVGLGGVLLQGRF
jgi:hypothetical protein